MFILIEALFFLLSLWLSKIYKILYCRIALQRRRRRDLDLGRRDSRSGLTSKRAQLDTWGAVLINKQQKEKKYGGEPENCYMLVHALVAARPLLPQLTLYAVHWPLQLLCVELPTFRCENVGMMMHLGWALLHVRQISRQFIQTLLIQAKEHVRAICWSGCISGHVRQVLGWPVSANPNVAFWQTLDLTNLPANNVCSIWCKSFPKALFKWMQLKATHKMKICNQVFHNRVGLRIVPIEEKCPWAR